MKAAVLRSFREAPRYEEFPDPVVSEGEVLVHVRAAGLHPAVRALASGSHYGSAGVLPVVAGIDGAGRLEDGASVFFAGPRSPYGTMAELASVPRAFCIPLAEGLDEVTAAAGLNPGLSGWLALTWRAKLARGETVLIMGATGVAGQLAVQSARLLGAARIVAAGRNKKVLERLTELGASSVVDLTGSSDEIQGALTREAAEAHFDVVIDYLWGSPTEALLAAIEKRSLVRGAPRIRLVQVGDSADESIRLRADLLRSSGLEIYGSGGGTVPVEDVVAAVPHFMQLLAKGHLTVDAEVVPLSEVESNWSRPQKGKRIVFAP